MNADPRMRMYQELGVDPRGLAASALESLRSKYGWNELPAKKTSWFGLLAAQFQDVMIYILLSAAAVSVIVPLIRDGRIDGHESINAVVILAIVALNAVLGFVQEWRAENAIALLQKLSAPQVKVRRNGHTVILPSRELLPGDVMLTEAGDRISADARITACASLEVDESSLTGESVPAAKIAQVNVGKGHAVPGMLYAGTLVSRGYGESVVTGIGLSTEIGKISSLVSSLKPPPTQLTIELKRVGERIGVLVLALCTLIFAAGVLSGMPVTDIFFTAVSLAVAAVPEGLPAIVTICLAIGVQRMIKRNALIRRLDAVETLGSVTVICADKTGTMTCNCMTVQSVWMPVGGDQNLAIEIAVSCNRAELPDIGDPTEVALLKKAKDGKIERLEIGDEEVPFTSEAKYMVTKHVKEGITVRYLKGAPEVIARFLAEPQRTEVLQQSAELSKKGLRVLAAAYGMDGSVRCAGLIALIDPPREDVKESIALARIAGIRTIMITGDHPETALAIAKSVGIETDGVIDGERLESMDIEDLQHALKRTSVFARVQPSHKVKILEAFQSQGHVVAMSGDGVNDAPALKRAHVGVAMGLKGTDVAREAGAMVLTDDNFSTIVSAIAEGRRIYDNIKKFVLFLMRSNLGEVLIVAGAMVLRLPLPLLPLHILWINLVTDSFPALALATEKAEEGIMRRKPRRSSEDIFTGEWTLLVLAGILNAGLTLTLFQYVMVTHDGDLTLARTAALTTTIVYQLFLAISTRTTASIFSDPPLRSPWLLAAILLSFGLHLLLLLTPLNVVFSVMPIPMTLWEEVFGGALFTFVVFECAKSLHHSKVRLEKRKCC